MRRLVIVGEHFDGCFRGAGLNCKSTTETPHILLYESCYDMQRVHTKSVSLRQQGAASGTISFSALKVQSKLVRLVEEAVCSLLKQLIHFKNR